MRWSLSNMFRLRVFSRLLKYIIIVLLVILFVLYCTFEPQIILVFYRRNWVQSEINTIERLSGCFDAHRISPEYNLTKAWSPKFTEIQTGRPVAKGMDCFNYAGTVQMSEEHRREWENDLGDGRMNYHTYWRTDLAPFRERQEWVFKSFFATQDVKHSRLIVWSNGDLSTNAFIMKWMRMYPEEFEVRVVDIKELVRGTSLEESERLRINDKKAWVDGDLVRLLVLWNYGGVWIDMDQLLTRDMSPLFEHEFVTQWDCFERPYQALNGAILHFYKHSPYLCEFFHIMSSPTSSPPRPSSTDWGSILYLKAWRRLIEGGIKPFKVLPWCFTDGRSCSHDVMLPDPFVSGWGRWGGGFTKGSSQWSREDDGREVDDVNQVKGIYQESKLNKALNKVFAVHLHNQWERNFPKRGWVETLLLEKYTRKLGNIGKNWS